jgi:hypothetical protein
MFVTSIRCYCVFNFSPSDRYVAEMVIIYFAQDVVDTVLPGGCHILCSPAVPVIIIGFVF